VKSSYTQRNNTQNSKQIFPEKDCATTVPISTFMWLWAIYIFPPSICLLCCRKYVDRSWENINRSQTHEYGNWDWGRAIPRKGIHKWDFRCSVVHSLLPGFSPFPPSLPMLLICGVNINPSHQSASVYLSESVQEESKIGTVESNWKYVLLLPT